MNRQHRVVIAFLFLLLIGNVSVLAIMDYRVDELDQEVDTIREQNEQYQHELAALHANGTSPTGAHSSTHTVDTPLPMYETRERQGVVTTMTVTSIAGDGIYVRVDEVTYRETIQEAVPSVYQYLSSHPEYSLPYNAVIVSIDPEDGWSFVDGNSLQLPLALGLLGTNPDAQLNTSVVATGAVSETGDVTAVGNIEEKALAARADGYSVFLVPDGQHVDVEGITVVEVTSIADAIEYAFEEPP